MSRCLYCASKLSSGSYSHYCVGASWDISSLQFKRLNELVEKRLVLYCSGMDWFAMEQNAKIDNKRIL